MYLQDYSPQPIDVWSVNSRYSLHFTKIDGFLGMFTFLINWPMPKLETHVAQNLNNWVVGHDNASIATLIGFTPKPFERFIRTRHKSL